MLRLCRQYQPWKRRLRLDPTKRVERWRLTLLRVKFVYWKQDEMWLGYLQEHPDYWTQGETLDDLKEHLRDLYTDLTSGTIDGIRRVDELAIA